MQLQFHGQFAVPVDKFIFERYFSRSLLTGVALECGGANGITESCCYFFEKYLGWKCINIEASPPMFRQMVVNRPDALNLNLALSDSEGMAIFEHAVHPVHGMNFGNGSLQHTPQHRAELVEAGCTFIPFAVSTKSYRKLIADHKIDRLDLMVLDVEGHERTVLKGMVGAAVLPSVLCIEVGHVPLQEIRDLVEPMGYFYDTQSFVNAFFVKNELRNQFALLGLGA